LAHFYFLKTNFIKKIIFGSKSSINEKLVGCGISHELKTYIALLSPVQGLPSSTMASRAIPQSYSFLLYRSQQVDNGFSSDFKVSLYNTGHNKCKELLPPKLHFNFCENPT
jgi:hypothetical protein